MEPLESGASEMQAFWRAEPDDEVAASQSSAVPPLRPVTPIRRHWADVLTDVTAAVSLAATVVLVAIALAVLV